MHFITVYSQPNCVQCNATYRTLDKADLDYEVVDVAPGTEAHAFITGLGHLRAPVVVVREAGEVVDNWSGFNPDKLAEWMPKIPALVAA